MTELSNTINYNYQPVHDAEAEKYVISQLMQNGNLIYENSDVLSPECFYDGRLKCVYQVIEECAYEGKKPHQLHISQMLEKKHPEMHFTLNEIMDLSNTTLIEDVAETCRYLYELSRRRRLLTAGLQLVNAGISKTEDFDDIMARLSDTVDHINETAINSITSATDASKELIGTLHDNLDESKSTHDISGIADFDTRAFLRPQALTVIAANSGHGKSCLATTIAYHVACEKAPVAYYSLEMSKKELLARIVSPLCNIPSSRLLYERLSADEIQSAEKAAMEVARLPIYFDERATTSFDAMKLSIRQLVRQKHLHGVIIDYLQILSHNGMARNITEEQFLGGAVRELKNLCKQLNIWIIVVSQLSRNHDSEEPKESYLRGSGQILEGCDNCVLLYRPSKHEGMRYSGIHSNVDPHGTAEINIVKARNANDGFKHILGFDAEHTHFYELDSIPYLSEAENDIEGIENYI